ncbi:hypothetical protein Hanom_Chr12g01106131 [Helianthus anomalus]
MRVLIMRDSYSISLKILKCNFGLLFHYLFFKPLCVYIHTPSLIFFNKILHIKMMSKALFLSSPSPPNLLHL